MIVTEVQTKEAIRRALRGFEVGSLAENALALFSTLGYCSEKRLDLSPNTAGSFVEQFDEAHRLNPRNALLSEWKSVDLLFQLTGDEITAEMQGCLPFEFNKRVDNSIIESYVFFAVGLQGEQYTRTQLAGITREINKLFPMPVMVLFRHGQALTLSIINRRLHKRDESRDVLEKVTLIKDISFIEPHRAHIDILFDLSLGALYERHAFANFVELHRAWQKTLDTRELNKRFFQDIANWYFWAQQNVVFPEGAGKGEEIRNATSVIRLLTRLMFCWFLKEKGLIPDNLFNPRKLQDILVSGAALPNSAQTTYYKAILQNLFFATLNQEMNTPDQPENRKFRNKAKHDGQRDQHYMIHNVYRYRDYFKKPDEVLQLFASVPFLNGGLFECLDKLDEANPAKVVRVDGFSDRVDNPLLVPDFLFFSEEREVDLNAVYGTRNKRYKVRGLIDTLYRYKFTVTENTPIEEEIALDPELLGRVFENLLAAYNPETGVTARKQTGSYYTPREIVNYMVDESLIAYLEGRLLETSANVSEAQRKKLNDDLRHLVAYNDEPHRFSEMEATRLIEAIDALKILDPACGSGAFPMGILNKLVFILSKLDPGNERWKEKQMAKAREIPDSIVRERALAEIEQAFSKNELDYGRKLYLIENCIFGVDIQPIAVQIAKLRCFISLIVDQNMDDSRDNRGIRPLPNLETKFVAADTLLSVQKPVQLTLRDPAIDHKEKELADVRRDHFTARTPKTKEKYRCLDAKLRAEIAALLKEHGFLPQTVEKLAYWDPYDQNASAEFFDPEWMFGVSDGFDITIGNPPYVRADSGELHLALRRAIEASGQYETLWEKWDLYIPFMERSYKLLKPGGLSTMIVSDAFCHSKYAQKSQTWFLRNSRIRRLDFFSKIKIFDAAVRNVTYLFQRADGSFNRPERRVHDPEFGVVTLLPSDEQSKLDYRVFFPEDTDTAVPRFSVSTVPLSQICYISKGMVVHADEDLARGAFELSDIVSDTPDFLHPKPFVEGKHLARWLPTTHKWLEWGTPRAPTLFSRPTFPELYDVKEKLISVDMSAGIERLRVVYDDQKLYHNHSAWSFVPWHGLSGGAQQLSEEVSPLP